MRRKLQAKLNSKKGFTLVELLIVVAIIAILVAVSIPLVNTSLDKARIATDQANLFMIINIKFQMRKNLLRSEGFFVHFNL